MIFKYGIRTAYGTRNIQFIFTLFSATVIAQYRKYII